MKDEALMTAPKLSPAEAAVNYMLQRIRVDANLRYHMIHTEAFSRLVAAEAHRTGELAEEIDAKYSTLADHCKSDLPKIAVLKNAIRKAVATLTKRLINASPWGADMIEELENCL